MSREFSMENKKELTNQVLLGDARTICEKIPNDHIQAIITSPPYFGHRKYSGDDSSQYEIGRDKNLDDYINNLVLCFEVIKPKLKKSGVLWLNLGDTYRNKELLGVPWRVAFALKDKGWILRSDIIWKKPNAMPSSVKSRPTTDHEYIFLFSKTSNYYYDADSIREPHVTFSENSKMKGGRNHLGKKMVLPNKVKIEEIRIYIMVAGIKLFIQKVEIKEQSGKFLWENLEMHILRYTLKNWLKHAC